MTRPAADQAAAQELRSYKEKLRRYCSARAGANAVSRNKRYNNNWLEPYNGGESPAITYEAQETLGNSLGPVQHKIPKKFWVPTSFLVHMVRDTVAQIPTPQSLSPVHLKRQGTRKRSLATTAPFDEILLHGNPCPRVSGKGCHR